MASDVTRTGKQLIALGKSKGYLTFEDVNRHMPDHVLGAEKIEEWLAGLALEEHGLEIVWAPSKVRPPSAQQPTPVEAATA